MIKGSSMIRCDIVYKTMTIYCPAPLVLYNDKKKQKNNLHTFVMQFQTNADGASLLNYSTGFVPTRCIIY